MSTSLHIEVAVLAHRDLTSQSFLDGCPRLTGSVLVVAIVHVLTALFGQGADTGTGPACPVSPSFRLHNLDGV